jgi:hypothetical protein
VAEPDDLRDDAIAAGQTTADVTVGHAVVQIQDAHLPLAPRRAGLELAAGRGERARAQPLAVFPDEGLSILRLQADHALGRVGAGGFVVEDGDARIVDDAQPLTPEARTVVRVLVVGGQEVLIEPAEVEEEFAACE